MASFSHAIRSFQSGDQSRHEFFAQLDRVLATDEPESARLLDVLREENARSPLPSDFYVEVQRRIVHWQESRQRLRGDETRVQTGPGDRLSPPTAPAEADGEQAPPGVERMKGVGDTLNGRFVLEECLGFGGMGTVYKALDLRKLEASDRKPYIAIKVLNVQFRGHPKSLIALQREAKKAQRLAHPNIVTVYDFDRDGSMVYLTMEYLSGQPLSQRLREPGFTGMPCADALRIVTGMGRALAYAHERGFVHCDFKPANVIITASGEVKVIDFGIARVFQKTEEDSEATVFDPGSLGGLTPAYASPEMLEHREPDPRDDIYALACITYELLTGRHPFDRVSALQARSAGMRPQRPKDLGGRQWRALQAALSFEREARTPTVARFLQELSGERRTPASLGLLASSLALAALAGGGLLYYWQSRPGPGEAPESPVATAEPPPPAVPAPERPAAQAPAPPLSLAAVTPVLGRLPCSALAASVRNSTLEVQGYLSQAFGSARLTELLHAIPGVETLKLDVQTVSDDKCGVINAFAPYWARHRPAGRAATIGRRAPAAELLEGDALVLDISTPGYDSYVSVDYYVLDGSVAHLLPNPRARDNQAPPNHVATIGSLGNWVISKPYGSELVVLLATPAPLFESIRPAYEGRADYLQAVEKRLAEIAGKYGPDRIAVDFVQINTGPR